MDFITVLPLVRGYSVIFVVVDRLSKYGHFTPLRTNYSSHSVAEAFLTSVLKLHGFPKSIVSDRDKAFMSSFWQHLLKLHGISSHMSSAYHPQTDGQLESLNKCLEMYLRCYVHDCPRKWLDFLPWAEYWYNTSYHTAIQMTPFKAVYGRDPSSLLPASFTMDTPPDLLTQLADRDVILARLKCNLQRAQARTKYHADKHRTELHFERGDLVLVKLQPYRQNSVALRKHNKLSLRYFGPFPIHRKIGMVAHELELPDYARIHPVFHVSMLKKFEGPSSTPFLPLPLMTVPEGPIISPVEVLDARVIQRGSTWTPQALIRWDGLPDPSWEFVDDFTKYYPTFDLGDKVAALQGGHVITEGPTQAQQVSQEEGNEVQA